jgi:hypothetical protein
VKNTQGNIDWGVPNRLIVREWRERVAVGGEIATPGEILRERKRWTAARGWG